MSAYVLVGSLVFACAGRTDLAGSAGGTNDAGTSPDASAPDDADATWDATSTIDAGSTADAAEPDVGAAVNCDGGSAPYAVGNSVCVAIDLSSYDRSCVSDSDCIAVLGGVVCNTSCCPDAAINVRGRACYQQQTLLPPAPPGAAPWCPNCSALARCIEGVCTSCGSPDDCHYSEWNAAMGDGLDAQASTAAGRGDAR